MKKKLLPVLLVLILATAVFIFRDPILDLLPIDQSRWVDRDGVRYLLDEDGDPRTGWVDQDGLRYYFHQDGAMAQGLLETGEGTYFLSENGHMATGWQEIGTNRFYFRPADGRMHTGWHTEGTRHFYFNEDGRMHTGWLELAGDRYYMIENGMMHLGWLELDGQRFYFGLEGRMHTGWLEYEGLHYFLDTRDGHMVSGWVETNDNAYYLQEDGTLATGLTRIDGILHNLDQDGLPQSGWIQQEGQQYYFGEDGLAHTGWLEYEGKKYYLLDNGAPAVGKLVIEEQAYFFTSSGVNFIMVNPWHSLPEDFEPELVNAHGAWLDPVCQEALGQMLADCRAAGYNPRIISSYRSIADQRVNLQRMVESMGGNYAAATQIVAVPGTSEHHLGLAFDIVDSAYPKLNHQQAQMPAQKWLMEHCWEYGFILRYPENTTDITGIIWEPWHYRYVGTELSLEIRDLGGIPLEVYIDNLTGDGTTCGGKTAED